MNRYIIAAVACLAIAGCSKIEQDTLSSVPKYDIVLTGGCQTKTSLGSEADGDLSILWKAGDLLGVYAKEDGALLPDAQNQIARLAEGENTGAGCPRGSFTTSFAIKAAAEYHLSIYYPYSAQAGDLSQIKHTVPAYQVQSSASESRHFGISGSFAYTEATFTTPQNMDYYDTPQVGFTLTHKTSAMWLKVTSDAALAGWKIKTVRVTAPEGINIAGDAVYTPSSDLFALSGNGSDTIVLDVPGGAVLSATSPVNLYLVTAPAELAGKTLKIEYVLENASTTETKSVVHAKTIGDNSAAFASGSIHRFTETIPAVDGNGWTSARIDVIDLSADGTANCYMVSMPGKYSFDATVIGNGAAGIITPLTTTHFHTDDPVIAPSGVKLMWQTAAGLIQDLAISGGKVTFTKADETYGNALVAVTAADGSILWSWHIWCTDVCGLQTYVSTTGTYEGMDRNLGATYASSALVTDAALRTRTTGLYYQWGRKDPFPGPSVLTSSLGTEVVANYTTPLMQLYDINGNSYSRPSKIAGSKTKINDVLKSIEYTILNPVRFVYCGSNTDYDWFATCGNGTGVSKRGYYLWGNPQGYDYASVQKPSISKTIYDPCPRGYMVPPADFYTAMKVQNTSNWGAVVSTDGGNSKTFVPYASGIQGNASKGTSKCDTWIGDGSCYMWTSSFRSADDDRNWVLTLKNSSNGYTTFIQAYGFPVRCIQEF